MITQDEVMDQRINCKVSKRIKKQLESMASENNMKLGSYVRSILIQQIERNGNHARTLPDLSEIPRTMQAA